MSYTKKKTIIFTLLGFFLVSVFFAFNPIKPKTVSAERQNDYLYYTSVYHDSDLVDYGEPIPIYFTFHNSIINDQLVGKGAEHYSNHFEDKYTFRFCIFENEIDNLVFRYTFTIISKTNSTNFRESLTIQDNNDNHNVENVIFYPEQNLNEVSQYKNLHFDEHGNITIKVLVNSPYNEYKMTFGCNYQYLEFENIFNHGFANNVYEDETDFVSLYSMLRAETQLGTLEDSLSDIGLARANAILNNTEGTTIRIRYLEDIVGTPFARPVYQVVTVPVVDGKAYCSPVISYLKENGLLDRDNLNCLSSHCLWFEQDTENGVVFYKAHYLPNTRVRAISMEGTYIDNFFDINKSFMDYYYEFTTKNLLATGMYEWFFETKILDDYPDLQDMLYEDNNGFSFDKLYGYFGLIFLPEGHTFNTFAAAFLGTETNVEGLVHPVKYTTYLSNDQYNILLSDYHYDFVATLLSNLFSFGGNTTSDVYMFYMMPDAEGFISEPGGDNIDDTDSPLEKESEKYTGFLGNIWGKSFDLFDSAVDGAGSLIDGLGNIGSLLLVIGIITAGVFIYIIIKKKK